MLRDRLKDMGLKITELADYLQVSRPTMYKFIEYYDNQDFSLINNKILKLFNYINEHELAGKKNVVNYILTNLVEVKEVGDKEENKAYKQIKNYLVSNPESNKAQLLTLLASKDTFDEVVSYLVEIAPLLKKRKLTSEQEELIKPYKNLLDNIKEVR